MILNDVVLWALGFELGDLNVNAHFDSTAVKWKNIARFTLHGRPDKCGFPGMNYINQSMHL